MDIMSTTEFHALARRVAHAEAELAVMRASARRSRRVRTAVEMTVLAGLAFAMGAMRSPVEAQGAEQTVTAPFVVKGKSGAPILRVREANSGDQNQLLLYKNGATWPPP